MSYTYTRASDSENPHRLPDVEVFQAQSVECSDCERQYPTLPGDALESCPECEGTIKAPPQGGAWGHWFAFLDGGLDCWSGDPTGPYPTEAEALAAARSDAGLCGHDAGDDEPCGECDTPLKYPSEAAAIHAAREED